VHQLTRGGGNVEAPASSDGAVHERIMSVVASNGGLVERVRQLPSQPGFPDYQVFGADLGDLGAVVAGPGRPAPPARGEVSGTGTGWGAMAERLAVVEAVERYSSSIYDERQFLRARARDLGDDALDLGTLPKCSATELADRACPVAPADTDAVIRWVRGVSLVSRRPVWVPAVLVFMNLATEGTERFALQVSTGCAAHVDLCAALVNAVCEVVERDALVLTWLQRLALPRITGPLPGPVADAVARGGAGDVQTHLFDATTDLGIPTVYAVDVTRGGRGFSTAVACATDLDAGRAVLKVLREAASGRIALSATRRRAERVEDFTAVWEGAVYMGRPERRGAFAFLLESTASRPLPAIPSLTTPTAAGDLEVVAGRLAASGYEAVAVDLTTDEAVRAGLRVVKVVVPGLMPLSFVHRARFLAHPRLYQAPARMGYPINDEDGLNPWPQPFA
jgi:ribosomal protein S12 methylthiotransferase accessory factor